MVAPDASHSGFARTLSSCAAASSALGSLPAGDRSAWATLAAALRRSFSPASMTSKRTLAGAGKLKCEDPDQFRHKSFGQSIERHPGVVTARQCSSGADQQHLRGRSSPTFELRASRIISTNGLPMLKLDCSFGIVAR